MKPKEKNESTGITQYIMEAAHQIFGQLGFKGATTNKIAERAGVSIGSFYRYFRDKDALLEHLIDGAIQVKREKIQEFLDAKEKMPLPQLAEDVANFAFDLLMADSPFLQVLYAQLAKNNKLGLLGASRKEISKIFSDYIKLHYEDIVDLERCEEALTILIHAFSGVILILVTTQPTREESQRSRRELMKLSRAYLSSLILE